MNIDKFRIKLHIVGIITIVLIVGIMWFFLYITEKQAGYYCDYCHKGSYRNKTEVLHQYGNTPCTVAKDSMHHFSWWMTAPNYKIRPKYVRE